MPNRDVVESSAAENLAKVKGQARHAGVNSGGRPSDQVVNTGMQGFSRNANEVNDRKIGAGQAHQDNATPSTFSKLKPSSPVGKGMELAENVSDAVGRVSDGVTGPNPGSYIQETVKGKADK